MTYHTPEHCRVKLRGCIRLAREARQDYHATKDPRYWQMTIEAIADGKYWRLHLRESLTCQPEPTTNNSVP